MVSRLSDAVSDQGTRSGAPVGHIFWAKKCRLAPLHSFLGGPAPLIFEMARRDDAVTTILINLLVNFLMKQLKRFLSNIDVNVEMGEKRAVFFPIFQIEDSAFLGLI